MACTARYIRLGNKLGETAGRCFSDHFPMDRGATPLWPPKLLYKLSTMGDSGDGDQVILSWRSQPQEILKRKKMWNTH